MSVLAIIPARAGSKGIPKKNFTPLVGRSPMNRAMDICNALRGVLVDYVVTSDVDWQANERFHGEEAAGYRYGQFLRRPAALAQDDTPMLAVVQHVLERIPGPPDQIIVLLQPTQPLRTPAHVTAAIALLEESQADSVVSVVPLPLTHSPTRVCMIDDDGRLESWGSCSYCRQDWLARRQAQKPAYVRDGTVYAFRRRVTVKRVMYIEAFNTVTGERDDDGAGRRTVTYERPTDDFYGTDCRPLIIDPRESCPLDTLEDWAEAERRLIARDAVS